MKKERIPIPKPRSNFLLIQCTNCGNEQMIFSCTTIAVRCKICDDVLAQPTGGKARIKGAIIRRLD